MKPTGISRPVDNLGRIVLPKEIRDSFDIKPKDLVEISIQGDKIILRKCSTACIFCDSDEELVSYEDRKVCKKCIMHFMSLVNL